jgi:hypothetical protein
MPETEVRFQPGDHGARFHSRLELAALRETLFRREPAEVRGALAGFRLYVVEVCLNLTRIKPWEIERRQVSPNVVRFGI